MVQRSVSGKVLGRTNREFPPLWLRLLPPVSAESDPAELAEAALRSRVPLDISAAPALWGGHLRGGLVSTLMQVSNSDYERASGLEHAGDLVQAHLLETLSAIGREKIDLYFLRVRALVAEERLSGALQALELAKEDGHIGFIGLYAEDEAAAPAVWRGHDAFELVCLDGPAPELRGLAAERRVGIVDRGASAGGGVQLLSVRSPGEVESALGVLR